MCEFSCCITSGNAVTETRHALFGIQLQSLVVHELCLATWSASVLGKIAVRLDDVQMGGVDDSHSINALIYCM